MLEVIVLCRIRYLALTPENCGAVTVVLLEGVGETKVLQRSWGRSLFCFQQRLVFLWSGTAQGVMHDLSDWRKLFWK